MIFLIVFLIGIFITLFIGFAAARSDLLSMKIPNAYSVYIAAAFVIVYLVTYFSGNNQVFSSILSHLISAVVTFVVTAILFAMRVIGAGDSKFGTACALWIGAKYLPIYLFFMTLCGGLLGAVALYIKRKKPFKTPKEGSWVEQVQSGKDKVPYGVAITFGMVIAFVYAGYFSSDVLGSFLTSKS